VGGVGSSGGGGVVLVGGGGVVLVGGAGEVCAWAGKMTDSTIGFDHIVTAVATPAPPSSRLTVSLRSTASLESWGYTPEVGFFSFTIRRLSFNF